MSDKTMYFGTRERMTWVKCPAYNGDISKMGWSTTSQYINGGASARRSATAHKEYQWSWNLASYQDIADITDYADGLYGQDLIYFLDPFATTTNLLPIYWSVPRLGVEDAPTFTKTDVRPSTSVTPTNTYSYPTRSAVYTFDVASEFNSLYIPIPPGYTLHFGAHGSAIGSAAVSVSDAALVPTVSTRVNYITNPSANTATTNWTASGTGAVLSRVATAGFSGTGFLRLTAGTAATAMSANGNTFPVFAGQPYAFSVYVKGTVGRSVAIRATWAGASATAASNTSLASTSTWQRITFTGTVPVGATAVRFDVLQAATGGLVGDVLDIDAALAELNTNTVGTPFDGSVANTSVGNTRVVTAWQGTEDNSYSQETTTVSPGTAVTLLSETVPQLTNFTLTGVSGANISFWGSGTLTLSGMVAQVLPTGTAAPTGDFVSGHGHSGCRFAASPSVQGYSAPQAMNLKSMSATLIETGAWE